MRACSQITCGWCWHAHISWSRQACDGVRCADDAHVGQSQLPIMVVVALVAMGNLLAIAGGRIVSYKRGMSISMVRHCVCLKLCVSVCVCAGVCAQCMVLNDAQCRRMGCKIQQWSPRCFTGSSLREQPDGQTSVTKVGQDLNVGQ